GSWGCAGVKGTEAGETLSCVPGLMLTTTLAVGAVVPESVTAYCAVAPPSATASVVGLMLMAEAVLYATSGRSLGVYTGRRNRPPPRLRPLTGPKDPEREAKVNTVNASPGAGRNPP